MLQLILFEELDEIIITTLGRPLSGTMARSA
jgi:hypothetical protein